MAFKIILWLYLRSFANNPACAYQGDHEPLRPYIRLEMLYIHVKQFGQQNHGNKITYFEQMPCSVWMRKVRQRLRSPRPWAKKFVDIRHVLIGEWPVQDGQCQCAGAQGRGSAL
ncbi:hypothetical protein BJV82DRAFT_191226 [Fennellomyces sp. T-0311]|nr:hypothetical protein BJV82DRAFT_191226 [Fennellomyces sp. T-0311]